MDMSHGMAGMDMSGMTSTNDSMPMMSSHFTASLPSVPLWFAGWQPTSAGTLFAACLGLFGLALLSRLLGALRHQAHMAWSMIPLQELSANTTPTITEKGNGQGDTVTGMIKNQARQFGPWVAEHEIPRGILASLHLGIEYFLMLAVMTFNVYFFIAIILGSFAGEVGFGRWSTLSRGGGHGH